MPVRAAAPVSHRLKQFLRVVCARFDSMPMSNGLVIQFMEVFRIYQVLRDERARKSQLNNRNMSTSPTLREFAQTLYDGWPRNLGSQQKFPPVAVAT